MDLNKVKAAIRTAGLEPALSSSIEVKGEDPFFRSPLQLATGAAAALAMVGSRIDEIWRARGGPAQDIRIDSAHAAVSLLSMWLLRIDGLPASESLASERMIASGQFTCADGRKIHLQPGFAHHAEAIVDILKCSGDRESVAAAIAVRPGEVVEKELSDAGVPAVIVRDWAQWQAHPQGLAMRDVPVVELEKIGPAPTEALSGAPRPLGGLRVLDLTRVLAGPTCARTLAEQGADVLHVDSPNLPDLLPAQVDTAHGKRMAFLDLDQEEGCGHLRTLAESADVFLQSYRTGSLARRGFGPEDLARIRPGIIYVSVNCYGHHGPWVDRHGYDGNAMAATGINRIHDGQEGRTAPGIVVAMNDYCTAYWAAYGVLQALIARAREGGSWHVRVSLTQSAMWFLRMGTPNDPTLGKPGEEVRNIAERYMQEEDSPYGRLRQLAPVLELSRTPAHWEVGTSRPGSHVAEWLPRL